MSGKRKLFYPIVLSICLMLTAGGSFTNAAP